VNKGQVANMDEDSELSDYPGEGMEDDMDGDFGETGQLSPTQTSPDRDSTSKQELQNFMV